MYSRLGMPLNNLSASSTSQRNRTKLASTTPARLVAVIHIMLISQLGVPNSFRIVSVHYCISLCLCSCRRSEAPEDAANNCAEPSKTIRRTNVRNTASDVSQVVWPCCHTPGFIAVNEGKTAGARMAWTMLDPLWHRSVMLVAPHKPTSSISWQRA